MRVAVLLALTLAACGGTHDYDELVEVVCTEWEQDHPGPCPGREESPRP